MSLGANHSGQTLEAMNTFHSDEPNKTVSLSRVNIPTTKSGSVGVELVPTHGETDLGVLRIASRNG